MTSPTPPGNKARAQLREGYGWYLAAAFLLVLGLAALMWYWRRPVPVITRRVLPELVETDHIEAQAGVLCDFNVLIITTDTTRADHIGCYGNRGVETPVIDGLARGGILCATAVTPSPSTLPGHSSLMTGLYPYHHGARANGTFRLKDEVTTLAERLREKGYHTAAVISAFVLDSRFGLDQGFETYDDDLTKGMKYSPHMFRERAAELTNEPAAQWLRDNGRGRFFMWVHYFDPHAVYLPPEPFRTKYAYHPYAGEIAYVDSQIGALLSVLDELGVRDNTLVVYTSDHGEGLGQHGEQTHSLLVYDATLHVPLIFNAPSRLPRGKVIRRQACLVDVVPSVLALLGEEVPEDLDGVNLCLPPEPGPRSVYIETISTMTLHGWAPLLGIRRDDYKYIFAPSPELYDLETDPNERKDIHKNKPDIAKVLNDKLVEMIGGDPFLTARHVLDDANIPLDDELRAKLGALGYVATVANPQDPAKQFQRDPKDFIHHWEKLQKGLNLRAQGKMSQALAIIEGCVSDVRGDIFARGILAGCYQMQGEYDKALELYRGSAEMEPNDETIHLGIALAHIARGKLAEAKKAIDRALQIEPQCAQAYISLGRITLRQGNEEKALQLYKEAIEMDPGSSGPAAYNEIGFLHLRAHRLPEARNAFREAIRIDALNGMAHDGLANVLIEEGKRDEAAGELAIALRFDPNQPRALATLAALLSDKGNQNKALELCLHALELSPRFAQAHNSIGLVYRRQGKLDLAEKHYKKAIEYGPHLDAPHVNLAQLYIKQGNVQDGMRQFEAALRANRYCKIALANLGANHFNEGRVDKAFRLYRMALRIDPDYALVHKHIASIYALRDKPHLSADHLRRSLELDPRQPEAEKIRFALTRAEQLAATRPASTSPPARPVDTADAPKP